MHNVKKFYNLESGGFHGSDSASEQPVPVSEDVENAAENYSINEHGIGNEKQYERGHSYNGFIVGAQWQKQQSKEESKVDTAIEKIKNLSSKLNLDNDYNLGFDNAIKRVINILQSLK